MNDTQEAAERAAGVEERALRCLDYRLTGAEAVITLSVMQEFARQELERQESELRIRIAEYEAMLADAQEISFSDGGKIEREIDGIWFIMGVPVWHDSLLTAFAALTEKESE